MGFFSWIFLGLIAGLIAKAIHPGQDPGGFFMTIIIGILGSLVGGWIASSFGFGTIRQFDIRNILIAVGGAILLLWLYRKLRK